MPSQEREAPVATPLSAAHRAWREAEKQTGDGDRPGPLEAAVEAALAHRDDPKSVSDAAAEALARRFWALRICGDSMMASWDDLPPEIREAKLANTREFIEREIVPAIGASGDQA